MKRWVLRSCQDLWTLPERSSFVGNWGQSEVPQRRPTFYSRRTEKTKTLIKLLCPWSISVMNVLAALQVHGGLAVLFRWISVFWISISPLRFALVSNPNLYFFFSMNRSERETFSENPKTLCTSALKDSWLNLHIRGTVWFLCDEVLLLLNKDKWPPQSFFSDYKHLHLAF